MLETVMRRLTKLFNTRATSVDEAGKTIRFKISDNQPDRMGEIVDQETWDFKNYLKNPILLWGHNPDEPENVLGTALSLDVEGGETYATVQLDEDINPKAGLVWKQLLRGTLRCVSVGFINKAVEHQPGDEDESGTPILKDNELLEISIVPIPANPRAVALSLKEGSISHKDARWLMESMRKEAELLEEQLKQEPKQERKSMTEEQAAGLLDAVTKLTEKVDDLAKENASLRDQVADLKPKEETEDERTAREAAEKEAADKKAAEEDTEEGKQDPAKGGEHDQPGAGEGDINPDADLTPEQEAQAREALELEPAA